MFQQFDINQATFLLKVWVIRVNLRKGKVKLVLVYIEFEFSKFELADGKWLENWSQIQGKLHKLLGVWVNQVQVKRVPLRVHLFLLFLVLWNEEAFFQTFTITYSPNWLKQCFNVSR